MRSLLRNIILIPLVPPAVSVNYRIFPNKRASSNRRAPPLFATHLRLVYRIFGEFITFLRCFHTHERPFLPGLSHFSEFFACVHTRDLPPRTARLLGKIQYANLLMSAIFD